MLAPIGGGLILYQAYGNLYAMTGFRKPAFVCIVVDMSRENASSVERIPSHSDASGGSTVCWASFGEETDEITDLHQILEEVLLTEHGDGIASIKGTFYQTKLEKELIDFDAHQEKRLSSLRTQIEQKQDDIISKINLLWKAISEKLDDGPICDTAGNPAAQMNFTSTKDTTREELQSKGIKSPSKLLSLKYLSWSSLAEQNRNPSSLKRVHFINSIVILKKEDKAEEEGNVETSKTEYEDHEMTVESEEEFED
ncbi:hypothetical protein Tco_0300443 [Tanacetum coccineum]